MRECLLTERLFTFTTTPRKLSVDDESLDSLGWCHRPISEASLIGPFEFKVEGRSKTGGTAEGCDFWDQNGVLLLHLRVQQQRKSKINELTMSDVIE